MLTVIIKRSDVPTVIQLTQENVMRELRSMNHSEMLLEDSWKEGLKAVRTPYVCLVEADCVLSGSYLSSNVGLMSKDNHSPTKGTGGYLKRAMLASCLGYKSFANRIYGYHLEHLTRVGDEISVSSWEIHPDRSKRSTRPYHIQVGFVPGAIIRMSSIRDIIDTFEWDDPNLVRMSTNLSFHLWDTNRRVQVNPNTTYISNEPYLELPPSFDYSRADKAFNIFVRQGI